MHLLSEYLCTACIKHGYTQMINHINIIDINAKNIAKWVKKNLYVLICTLKLN